MTYLTQDDLTELQGETIIIVYQPRYKDRSQRILLFTPYKSYTLSTELEISCLQVVEMKLLYGIHNILKIEWLWGYWNNYEHTYEFYSTNKKIVLRGTLQEN